VFWLFSRIKNNHLTTFSVKFVTLAKSIAAGMNEYAGKPIDMLELALVMRKHIAQDRDQN